MNNGMSLLSKIIRITLSGSAFLLLTHAMAANTDSAADQNFLLLRDAANKENSAKATALAGQLRNYAIPSYVDYYQLKAHCR